MSEFSDQLAGIVTAIETVTDVGNVHDHPRYGNAADFYIATIDDIRTIRAWEIGSNGATVENRIEQGSRHRYRPWRIQGYHGPVDDELDDTGAVILQSGYKNCMEFGLLIGDAIAADRTLGGTCLDISTPDGTLGTSTGEPNVLPIPSVGNLLWGVEVTFWTWTIVTP